MTWLVAIAFLLVGCMNIENPPIGPSEGAPSGAQGEGVILGRIGLQIDPNSGTVSPVSPDLGDTGGRLRLLPEIVNQHIEQLAGTCPNCGTCVEGNPATLSKDVEAVLRLKSTSPVLDDLAIVNLTSSAQSVTSANLDTTGPVNPSQTLIATVKVELANCDVFDVWFDLQGEEVVQVSFGQGAGGSFLEDAGTILLPVELNATTSQNVVVNYSITNGTASSSDYSDITAGSVTIPAGSLTSNIQIDLIEDSINEADETFTVTLTGATNAVIDTSNDTASVTIVDNDFISISIDNVTAFEASGTTFFPVSLSGPSEQTIKVNFSTADGTAIAPGDYTSTAGQLVFIPGQISTTIMVTIIDDALAGEESETFTVNLSNPVNATILDSTGQGVIIDSNIFLISIDNVTVSEASGTATFTVSGNIPSDQTITVNFSTADGTAISPGDYTSTSGQLAFSPGQTSATITVAIVDDAIFECDQTFTVNLSNPVNATILDGTGQGVIISDDPASISIDNVIVFEDSGTATFTVSLVGECFSDQTITVNFSTADGTAIAPGDYTSTATAGLLVFIPGQTSATITVAIVDDANAEGTETFFVNLSNPVNTTIFDGTGQGVIFDND